MDNIAERLSLMEDLYFPRSLHSHAGDPSRRKLILLELLTRDPAVFLERYGLKLTSEELREFDTVKENYEVNWHLNHLRSLMNPTSDEVRSKSVTVKNRRRAYLDKLICYGNYFSEEAMREREPYLHHEYVGKFQDLSGRSMARPGERWSETLLRRSEEAILIAKIRGEQQRLGVAERDWVSNEWNYKEEEEEEEEEEESEEEEKDEDEKKVKESNGDLESAEVNTDPDAATTLNAQSITTPHQADKLSLSAAEMQDQMDQFTYIMQQKFLLGEDSEYLDYSKIDNDETLDDHWQKEANHDAEDKYFSED